MLLVQIYVPRVFPIILSKLQEVMINYGRKSIGLCCEDRRDAQLLKDVSRCTRRSARNM